MTRRMKALIFCAVGVVVASPAMAAIFARGTNLVVVAPGLYWLLWVIPAAGVLGGGLLAWGLWIIIHPGS